VIWPGALSWVSEGIGEVALDRENIAAITRQKEVYLYFGGRFALGRPLPARSDTNSHGSPLLGAGPSKAGRSKTQRTPYEAGSSSVSTLPVKTASGRR
jgi:hypothetical protein